MVVYAPSYVAVISVLHWRQQKWLRLFRWAQWYVCSRSGATGCCVTVLFGILRPLASTTELGKWLLCHYKVWRAVTAMSLVVYSSICTYRKLFRYYQCNWSTPMGPNEWFTWTGCLNYRFPNCVPWNHGGFGEKISLTAEFSLLAYTNSLVTCSVAGRLPLKCVCCNSQWFTVKTFQHCAGRKWGGSNASEHTTWHYPGKKTLNKKNHT